MTSPIAKPPYVVPNSLSLTSTLSTVELYARLRLLLLQYVSPAGDRLVDYLGAERIWVRNPPAPVVFPYVAMQMTRTSDAAYNGYRETMLLEVQCMARPESQLALAESAMDVVDQCLTSVSDNAAGLMVCRSRTRQTMPVLGDIADAAVVGVIATYTFYLWPQVLTSRV